MIFLDKTLVFLFENPLKNQLYEYKTKEEEKYK